MQITGYVIPYAMIAAAVGSISNGLYSTFSPTTSTAQWVGYQILNGFGRGVGMPMVSKHTFPSFSKFDKVTNIHCRQFLRSKQPFLPQIWLWATRSLSSSKA